MPHRLLFHVQKLAIEALQHMRIQYRWEAIEQENTQVEQTKKNTIPYHPEIFENGDTRKQLLARSRYLLYKSSEKWTTTQKQRAKILFNEYPDIENAYIITDKLRKIYNQKIPKDIVMTKLAHWFREMEESDLLSFNTLKRTTVVHYNILNYFNNRSTHASAESFNAKVKNFRL